MSYFKNFILYLFLYLKCVFNMVQSLIEGCC